MTEPDFELPHDVLLGGDFFRQLGPLGSEMPQITAPVPLDGGGAVFTPQQMGLVNGLGPLLALLREGLFSVFPLESTGPLEKGAGHACLAEAFAARGLHPLDDSAELATRLLAPQPHSVRSQQEVNQTLRVAGVLHRVPVVELAEFDPQTQALECLPLDVAARLNVLPLLRDGDLLIVALSQPLDAEQRHLIRFVTQCRVVAVVATQDGIHRAIGRCYASHDDSDELDSLAVGELGSGSEEDELRIWSEAEALARQAPIVRLVNTLLADAVSRRASDIHIRPGQKTFEVLYRINGTLVSVRTLRRALLPPVVGRIKILASMNSAEHRLPQDGRIRITENHAGVDLRISIIPSQFGESVVIRILARTVEMRNLDAIGFEASDLERLRDLLRRSMGIVLVTGPTGSGKTTTLYSTLKQLATPDVNVCTIEDPIEMIEASFNQVQVHHVIEMGFAEGVRALMRQDPDIIMVGEIRDLETADMAVQAALTGHLVLSTLHTNDAPTAVTRLLDLGVPAYLLNSTLLGIMAQRLVRTLCPHCKKDGPMSPEEEEMWEALVAPWKSGKPKTVYRPVGCLDCRMTGYMGRVGLYEIMLMSADIRKLITPSTELARVREQAYREGMKPLRISGAMKVAAGVTTLEEVIKVAPPAQSE